MRQDADRIRHHVNLHSLTADDVRSLLRRWEDALRAFGLVPNASADLALMPRRLAGFAEWLRAGSPAASADRARKDGRYIDQVWRIVLCLEALGANPGATDQAIWLLKQIDRLDSQSTAAQDRLFEIEVAACLVRGGLAAAFAEPDVTVTLRSSSSAVGLACKRVQSETKVLRRLKDGIDPVARSGRSGVVVMNLEPIINQREPGDWLARDIDEATTAAVTRMQDVIHAAGQYASDDLLRRAPAFLGVIWWGFVSFRLPPHRYQTQRIIAGAPTGTQDSEVTIRALVTALYAGGP